MSNPLSKIADIHYGKSPQSVADQDGIFPVYGTGGIYIFANKSLFDGPAVIVARKGSLGRPHFASGPFWASDTTYAVVPKKDTNPSWLFRQLSNFELEKLNEATGVPSISREWLAKIEIKFQAPDHQNKIAAILETVDLAIEQTEALIAKYEQVKAGMMQDLFTRGLTPEGKLRPTRQQAPDQYQKTPIGWIPKEWEIEPLEEVKESLIDGPFGSNLKSEHYVEDPGVRVVRLQNVQTYKYSDADRAFISDKHAAYLVRHSVESGDVLIAGLGEDRYPVGRACVFPQDLPNATNKADCFRLRCLPLKMNNLFMMYFLNTVWARRQIRRFEQGVTRPRINLGNLNRIFVLRPKLTEQEEILSQLNGIETLQNAEHEKRQKLRHQKSGLMHDLLTGKVAVQV